MPRIDRKLNSIEVLDAVTGLFIPRGFPECKWSDNGAKFIPKRVRVRIAVAGVKTAHFKPGSPKKLGTV